MEKSLWKEAVATAAVIMLAVSVGALVMNKQKQAERQAEAVHYHAGFQIYNENGTLLDFSGMEYMEIAPCNVGGVEDEADETIDLHNGVGDVVHVHHADMTWMNVIDYLKGHGLLLPTNLGEPTSSLSVTGFVNNEEVASILSYPIKPYDSVVMVIGNLGSNFMNKLNKAVTVEHIKEAEAEKENCGV